MEETMTTAEAKIYWKDHRDDDPILEEYDSFAEWYNESKRNGYIKEDA